MSSLTLDPALSNQLRKINQPIELLDEGGGPAGDFRAAR